MSKKHFTNYNKPDTIEVEPTVEEVKEEVVEVTEDEIVEKATVTGVVANCGKLRVRESASSISGIVCEIAAGSEVTIDETKSTDKFYKVCTASGVEGYCMKEFIETNK